MNSELLLPVGNMSMCLAAIHNGADAIYVGAPVFNARGRSDKLSLEELKEMVDLCHLYGVKVHVAFNVLIFEKELKQAKQILQQLVGLGVDALIIQDLGLAKMARTMYPELVIHGSTQMTVTNHKAMEFLSDLNIQRFVLGRENSIDEIKKIRENTDKELEVFVHGALCVAYSGQCFTSESIGGRSANRGQCAQSCRFSYELRVDGELKDLRGKEYLVSPQDLCGINEVRQLQEMGVESFKVEGRLKKPAFVASVARNYKSVMLGLPGDIKKRVQEMAQTYSRGFFSGWLHGVDHQRLVGGLYGNNKGLEVGYVRKINKQSLKVSSSVVLQAGQGLLFTNEVFNKEIPGKIFEVQNSGKDYTLHMGNQFALEEVEIGDRIFLSSSPALIKELDKTYSDYSQLKRIPVSIELSLQVGKPALLKVSDIDGNQVEVAGVTELEKAQKPLDDQRILSELSALSRTAYSCEKESVSVVGSDVFISQKEVKKLRQEAISQLNQKRVVLKVMESRDFSLPKSEASNSEGTAVLNILLREKEQALQVIKLIGDDENAKKYIGHIYLDFEFGQHYDDSLKALQEVGLKVALATNRILKPGEYHHLNALMRMRPDAYLVRNLGAAHYIKQKDPDAVLVGDFSLNVANSLSADYLFNKGLSRLSASYDLDEIQINAFLKNTQASKIEITIHQYMPSFHMEHCVFAAFLSEGHSYKDCGKPCERHRVELKDQFGNDHFIKADQECRNTMFNAKAQSSVSLVEQWRERGVENFRLEFLFEKEDQLRQKLMGHLALIQGSVDPATLIKKIKTIEKYGLAASQV